MGSTDNDGLISWIHDVDTTIKNLIDEGLALKAENKRLRGERDVMLKQLIECGTIDPALWSLSAREALGAHNVDDKSVVDCISRMSSGLTAANEHILVMAELKVNPPVIDTTPPWLPFPFNTPEEEGYYDVNTPDLEPDSRRLFWGGEVWLDDRDSFRTLKDDIVTHFAEIKEVPNE